MSQHVLARLAVATTITTAVLAGGGTAAVAAPQTSAELASSSVVALVPSQDPPVGADANGKPYAPCGVANDGQVYYTKDAQGYDRQYICSPTDSGFDWLEVFKG